VSLLDLALWAGVVVFMVGSLAAVGLSLSPRAALAPLTHQRFVARTFIANWVVCPAVAYALLQVIPLARPYATGLVLLALAPCAPFAPAMVQKAGGDLGYMTAFMILSTVATVIVMPLAVPSLLGVPVDPFAIARPIVLFVMMPLLIGMAVKALRPDAAARARPAIAAITNIAAGGTLALMTVVYGQGVLEAIGSYAIATQVAFVAVVTVVAHWMGVGLADEHRSVLTVGVCTRNLGAALAPLAAIDPDPRTIVMIAVAAPVTVALSALTARWLAHGRAPQLA
jgi:BASS family bile acid:Na+ symporter